MRDIYNPPPPPIAWEEPTSEPLSFTMGDLVWLLVLCLILFIGAAWAWAIEPALGIGITVAGLFVVLESWFSALTFLHRHPRERTVSRGLIFLAALVPWILGIGGAATLMMVLFWASDRSY
jgi:hypothetical protein